MIGNAWGKLSDPRDLSTETTASNLRMLDEEGQKGLLFNAIRACDLPAIRNILQVNRSLVNGKMYGYEGTDVYDVINSKTKRCYFYTGQEKDGFFYPLHVCTEAGQVGHKNLTILLVRAGAEELLKDYRGCTAEDKCNGQAVNAFFELRGFRFESSERYQGRTDKNGARHGQGVVFFKCEGYQQEEKQLFRGSFKNGAYHGHGTLYWPGTDVINYVGRFKAGLRHGRGIEFNAQSHKIYQGAFRDDQREGRGEEFIDGRRCYKGEFGANTRHGFGWADMGEGVKYFGRYEHGAMGGVGILCQSNGDRFEGMMFNNKPDGLGSFYQTDSVLHGTFQGWRRLKEADKAFSALPDDMPDQSNQNMFAEIMSRNGYNTDAASSAEEGVEGPDGGEVGGVESPAAKHHPSSARAHGGLPTSTYRSFVAYYEVDQHLEMVPVADRWKVQLGKYLKLPLKEARAMGLVVPEGHLMLGALSLGEGGNGLEQKEADDEGPDDDDVDEVTGYHFVDCTTLFVSYVYVNSAAKVFEDRVSRAAPSETPTEFPDFEAVYHLVIDAVDTYNDRWETVFKQQQEIQAAQALADTARKPYRENANSKKAAALAAANLQISHSNQLETFNALGAEGSVNSDGTAKIEDRRQMFMSETERKAELTRKQRAELAVKKGTAELHPQYEKQIEREVLGALETELSKLLVDEESEGSVQGGSQSQQQIGQSAAPHQHQSHGAHQTNGGAGGKDRPKSPSKHGSKNIASRSRLANSDHHLDTSGSSSATNSNAKKDGTSRTLPLHQLAVAAPAVNIDDLFDLDAATLTAGETSGAGTSSEREESGVVQTTNEFAAELLYIIQTSREMT